MTRPIWPELKIPVTTAIGSLPHHNVDSALEYAFRWRIPFLPQMPARNSNEYMIQQALEGLPGLISREKGEAIIDLKKWEEGTGAFAEKLDTAFRSSKFNAFEAFEPTAGSYACWGPFQWELAERGVKVAKIQMAGPMTCQWALRFTDGKPADSHVELSMQIFRLVFARATAMIRNLKSAGVTVLLYIDEPGFYCFSLKQPRHLLGLEELRIFLNSLRKEGVFVGLHCCSNTDWSAVLGLGIDVLSIDTLLSIEGLLSESNLLNKFISGGGRLSLGVVPTAAGSKDLVGYQPTRVAEALINKTAAAGLSKTDCKKIFEEAVYTPACGLALHRIEEAEKIFGLVEATAEACYRMLNQ